MRSPRLHHWRFVVNDVTERDINDLLNLPSTVQYFVYNMQEGITGRRWINGIVYFNERKTVEEVKSAMKVRATISIAVLDRETEISYCKEGGTFVEWGVPVNLQRN